MRVILYIWIKLAATYMEHLFTKKTEAFFDAVTADGRWNIQDELLFQVFGLTLYGYAFGVGRLLCFLDTGDIDALVEKKLMALGAGEKYVNGLIAFARSTFEAPAESVLSRIVGTGYAHFASEDATELKESVFINSRLLS